MSIRSLIDTRALVVEEDQRSSTHPPPLRSLSVAQVLPPDGGEHETTTTARIMKPMHRASAARDHPQGGVSIERSE